MGCTTRFRGLPTWRDHSRLTNPTERRAARAAPARRLSTRSPRHSSSGFPIHRTKGPFSSLLPNIWRASFSSAFQATTTDRRPRTSNPAAHRDSHPLLPPVAPGPDPRELPSIHPPVAHLPSVPAHDRRLGCGPSKPRRKQQTLVCRNPPSVSVPVDHTSPDVHQPNSELSLCPALGARPDAPPRAANPLLSPPRWTRPPLPPSTIPTSMRPRCNYGPSWAPIPASGLPRPTTPPPKPRRATTTMTTS